MANFAGFGPEVIEFYRGLAADNSREYFQHHKAIYDDQIRTPMLALLNELEDEFGPGKAYRPNRDVRFSTDKSPYKTHQGGYVGTGPACGWYTEISGDGVMIGGGFYHAESERLVRLRKKMAGKPGAQLEQILAELQSNEWIIEGERLKTAPRGYAKDHPRIELLRYKSITPMIMADDEVVHRRELLDQVRDKWRELRPLVEWLTEGLET